NSLVLDGITSFAVVGDVSKPEDCKLLVEQCVTHFGGLDVLINNAGIASRGRIIETTPETWSNILNINTLGVINTTFYALPHLLKSKGSVIIISSMAGKVGVPGHSGYSVSKMGLTAYAKALQSEYNSTDLHCGLIFVGFTINDEQKQILAPDGSYSGLKERKGIKLAKQEDVSKSIAQVIVKRKKEKTLTVLGKLQHIMLKFAPRVVYSALKKSYKDYDKMYEA
ncbi:MAG: dehydrogenase/reductase SDR family protein 7B, partial [Bacteroidia bacterium]